MSCCGRPPTPARDARGTPPTDRQQARPAERREVASLVRLCYVGTASVLVTGPATRQTYAFSTLQPARLVDARDAIAMLRTRLFVRR
jgi:hypothetical protein